jgi:hypothetical protein
MSKTKGQTFRYRLGNEKPKRFGVVLVSHFGVVLVSHFGGRIQYLRVAKNLTQMYESRKQSK